jgi:hypothetical protein
MYREDEFVLSHRPYAVDLNSLRPYHEDHVGWLMVDAIWFRRKNGITAACAGLLDDLRRASATDDPVRFLEEYDDGRYGGRPFARWDGASVWYAGQDPEENARHLELLRTALDAYHANPKAPDLGERWNRWWRF